ncbi:MAG: methyltransferase FkbM [Flaviaesturariibacter sp.]|nr:methyltransferase FkbM [Flaviaesturariibacter sp.]
MRISESFKLRYRAWKYRLHEDPAEIGYLLRSIRPGMTVFDVGAHKGGYTYWMARAVGRGGTVIAFEPQAAGAGLLKTIFGANVRVEEVALSDGEGTALFYIQPQRYSVSFEASVVNKYENASSVTVRTTTIDAYCRSHGLGPAFIKIDVEGFEMEVLAGGEQLLSSVKPVMLIEIEERHIGRSRMLEIFSFLESRGYAGTFFDGGTRRPLADFDPAVHQDPRSLMSGKRRYCNNFVFEPRV